MQHKKIVSALILAGFVSSPVYANDSTELEDLRALVQQLDQKVKVLERKSENNEEAAVAIKKERNTSGKSG